MVTDLSPERLHGLSWIVPSGSRAGGHDYQHLKRKHKEDPVNNPAPPARKRKQKKKARFGRTQRPKSQLNDKWYQILLHFFPNSIE